MSSYCVLCVWRWQENAEKQKDENEFHVQEERMFQVWKCVLTFVCCYIWIFKGSLFIWSCMSNVSFVQYVTCKCLDDDALCRISRLVTIKVPYNTNGFFSWWKSILTAHAILCEYVTNSYCKFSIEQIWFKRNTFILTIGIGIWKESKV